MTSPRIWTFFYGSFINLEVLAQVGYVPEEVEVARLDGFDIRIRPLANLVPSDRDCVWGILAPGTHAELDRLYRYAETGLGGRYLPEAVLARTRDGRWRPALCYLAPEMDERPPEEAYLERILTPARAWAFPAWYLRRLESFRTSTTS